MSSNENSAGKFCCAGFIFSVIVRELGLKSSIKHVFVYSSKWQMSVGFIDRDAYSDYYLSVSTTFSLGQNLLGPLIAA